jgi:hypothetical protein
MLMDTEFTLFLTHVGHVANVRKQPASLRSDSGPHHRNHRPTSPEYAPAKAAGNLKKYRISFDKAVTVFNDPLSSTLPDDQHCEVEDLFIIVGRSSRQVGGPDLK